MAKPLPLPVWDRQSGKLFSEWMDDHTPTYESEPRRSVTQWIKSQPPNPRKLPYVVDPLLLKRFLRLVDRTDAKVILSSTWRYDPAGLFSAKYWGIPYIDVLPDMPKRPRRDEILAWLKAHPDTDRFAVIDDEDDELDELPLFQPSAATVLTDEIVEGVVAYLSGKTNRDMLCSRGKRFLQNIHALLKGHEG